MTIKIELTWSIHTCIGTWVHVFRKSDMILGEKNINNLVSWNLKGMHLLLVFLSRYIFRVSSPRLLTNTIDLVPLLVGTTTTLHYIILTVLNWFEISMQSSITNYTMAYIYYILCSCKKNSTADYGYTYDGYFLLYSFKSFSLLFWNMGMIWKALQVKFCDYKYSIRYLYLLWTCNATFGIIV